MWLFGVEWQMFNGDDDDEEDENEGDFDWSRKEYIRDIDKLGWLAVQAKINLSFPCIRNQRSFNQMENFSPVALDIWQIQSKKQR